MFAFDASNYAAYQHGLEVELAGNKRSFWNDYYEGIFVFPLLLAGIVYIIATSDVPFWHAVLSILAMAACVVAAFALMIRSYGTPRAPPLQVTMDGWIVLGRRHWSIEWLSEVELSGHYLAFRNPRGRTLFEVREFQTGDLESFVHSLKRQSPNIVVRASAATMRPRPVTVTKGS